MSDHENYGEKFEGMTIVAMCALILACVAGVLALQRVAHHECTPNHYTYCGDEH